MGRIGRKKKLRSAIFYVGAAFVLLLLLMYRTSIWVALVGVLNTVAQTYDSLAGR